MDPPGLSIKNQSKNWIKFSSQPLISIQDIESVNNYIISGSWITENKVTKELEDKLGDYLGRKFAVGVPNGTIAIYLALLAAGVQKGMKVVVPNLTTIATINAILWANAEPVLIDIDETLCMSYEKLLESKVDIDCLILSHLMVEQVKENQLELTVPKITLFLLKTLLMPLGRVMGKTNVDL